MKHADLVVTEVEALTLRDVAGAGSQLELVLRLKSGTLAVRLVSRRARTIRVTDLRARDRKGRKTPFISVPCALVKP